MMIGETMYESAEERRKDRIKAAVTCGIIYVTFSFLLLAWFMCWI